MAKLIIGMLPPSGKTYVEPFVGHGNVFWAAASALNYRQWWINDIQTIPLFEAIREIGDTVDIPERTKEEYYRQWDAYKTGDKRAIILQPQLTFGGGGYGKAGPGERAVRGQQLTPKPYDYVMKLCSAPRSGLPS